MTDKSNTLKQRLNKETPILLDGATGTMLEKKGVSCELPLWSSQALIEDPELLIEVHREYIREGSEIITANTFRTNKRTFTRAGLEDRSEELTDLALKMAKKAVLEEHKEGKVWIAGSMAPLEDCFRPDLVPSSNELQEEHREHAKNLYNAGADIFLVETMNSIKEAKYALEAAYSYGKPVFASFVASADGTLLSGESFKEVYELSKDFPLDAVLINCTPVKNVEKPLKELLDLFDIPVGVYANIGYADDEKGWESTHDITPTEYAINAKNWVKLGVKLIGACCGTTPEYINELNYSLNK